MGREGCDAMSLSFEEYQKRAADTARYPKVFVQQEDGTLLETNFIYPSLGLGGEAGEILEKVKKIVRDQHGAVTNENRAAIAKEVGDELWYLASICKEFGLDMGEVAQGNLDKLAARASKGTLSGSGDNR